MEKHDRENEFGPAAGRMDLGGLINIKFFVAFSETLVVDRF